MEGSPAGSLMARLTEYVFKRHQELQGSIGDLWERFVERVGTPRVRIAAYRDVTLRFRVCAVTARAYQICAETQAPA